MNRLLLGYSPDFDLLDGLPQPAAARQRRAPAPISFELSSTELASELLDAAGKPRLSALLRRLVRRAAAAAGRIVNDETAGELTGLLRRAARLALPPSHGPAGSAAARASRFFGVELEGLSPEDQEFEAARRFALLAAEAARQAALAPQGLAPGRAARRAAARAAQRYAPGWLHPPSEAGIASPATIPLA